MQMQMHSKLQRTHPQQLLGYQPFRQWAQQAVAEQAVAQQVAAQSAPCQHTVKAVHRIRA
jgi:hypothetical protein